MFILTLLVLVIEHIVRAGQIDTLDYSMDYINVGYTTQLKFVFRLQSGLGLGNYLSLQLPLKLEASMVGQVPQNVTVVYNEVSSADCSAISLFPGATYKDTLNSPNWYHFQFLDLDLNPRALKAGTYYSILITSPTITSQQPNINTPVLAQTTADYTVGPSSWIVYDFNRVFAQLEFVGAPPSTLVAVSTAPLTNLDTIYSILVDITPTVRIRRGARITIQMLTDQDYTFSGDFCTSSNSSNNTIPALMSNQYQCLIDHSTNQINVQIYMSLQENIQRRFQLNIRTPKFVKALGGGFKIFTMTQFSNQIVELTTIPNLFLTQPLTWANLTTYFAWNLSLSTVQASSINIFRSDQMNLNPFFNSFRFEFSPSNDTPVNQQLRLTLQLNAELTSSVLQGSVSENLPSFSSQPVQCVVSQLPADQKKLVCINVGTLQLGMTYHISVKVAFPYQVTANWQTRPTNISAQFGMLQVETYNPKSQIYDALSLIQLARDPNAIWLTQNSYLLVNQQPSNGFTLMHSQSITQMPTIQPITQNNYGLKSSTSLQRLIFTTFANQTAFVGAGGYTYGMDMFTSPLIQPDTKTVTYLAETTSTGVFNISTTVVGGTTPGASYTRMTFGADTVANVNLIFGNTANSTNQYSIGPFYININASQYSFDTTIDFMGGSYQLALPSSIPQIVRYFAYNSYTIADGTTNVMANLQVSLVNFWTNTTYSLDGSKFPAFIRVAGYLTGLELRNVQRIAIFFDNLTPFTYKQNQYGQNQVSCSSTLNAYQKCFAFQGVPQAKQSIYSLSRVEFELFDTISGSGPSSPFQLLIPVQSIPNVGSIFLQIATIIPNPRYLYKKFYGSVQDVKSSLTYQTYTVNVVPLASNTNINLQTYNLQVSSAPTPLVGSMDSSATISVGHNDVSSPSVILTNTATSIGSAFFYQGNWNLLGMTFLPTSLIIDNSVNSNRCIGYTYTQIKRFWGVFCPFSLGSLSTTSTLSLIGLNYPNQAGVLIPSNTYAGWSDNTGLMQSFALDSQTATMSPGTITIPPSSFPTIQNNWFDQTLVWQFQTSNSLPSGGTIVVSFPAGTIWLFSTDPTNKCYLLAESPIKQLQHTCVMTIVVNSTITYTITTTTGAPFTPQNLTLTQYGVDMPNITGTPLAYTITTNTLLNSMIDQSIVGSSQLLFNNLGPQTQIQVQSVMFERTSGGARGSFQMQFQIQNRGIFYNQLLIMNIAMLDTSNNKQFNMNCAMYNLDGSVSYVWNKAIIQNFTTIVFSPFTDLTTINQTYIFKCLNTVVPMVYIMPNLIVQSEGQTVIPSSPSIFNFSIDTNATTISSTGVSKTVVLADSILSLSITLQLKSVFDQNSALYINLPIYYNSYDNANSLTCMVNGVVAYCVYTAERTLKLKLFVIKSQNLNIVITGIFQPPQSYTGGTIYVMVNYDDHPTRISEYGVLNDVIPSSGDTNVLSLLVSGFSVSNLNIREQTNYTFYASTQSTAISSGQYIIIDFPQVFGLLFQLLPPSLCMVTSDPDPLDNSTAASTTYSQICSTQGSRVYVQISTTIPPSTNYQVQLIGITNPEQSLCAIQKPILSVLSNDNSTVIAKSTISRSNIASFNLQLNSQIKYPFWKQEGPASSDISYLLGAHDPSLIVFNYNYLTVVPGQYSSLMSVGLIGQAFDKQFNYTISSNLGSFQVLGDQMVYPGDGKDIIRIGCSPNNYPQKYFIFFTKLEQKPLEYSQIGILGIQVVAQYFQVQFPAFYVPVMQYSLPMQFDYTEAIPVTPLVVTLTITPFDINNPPGFIFQLNGQTTLNFTLTNTSYTYQVFVISNTLIKTVLPNHTATLNITYSGNSSTYYQQSQVQLILVTPVKQTIVYSMALDQLSMNSFKQVINITSNVIVEVFYHVCLQYGPVRNLSYTQQQKLTNVSISDYYQEQYGSWLYTGNFNTSQSNTIKKLRAHTWYTITTWAVDLYQNTSQAVVGLFITQNNNGRLMRLRFHFTQLINVGTKQKIACWLCTQYAYPCMNVVTNDALYCNSLTQYNLSFNSTSIKTQFNSYRLLQEDSVHERILQTNQDIRVSYYFIPISYVAQDLSWQSVVNGQKDPLFLQYFLGNFTNSTGITMVEIQEIITSLPPQIITNVSITSTQTSVRLDNMGLRVPGLIWGYITMKFDSVGYAYDSGQPTPIQIKYMANALNQTVDPTRFFILPYEENALDISYTFSGLLPAKWYIVYVIATENNPSLWAQTSKIYSMQIKTQRVDFAGPTATIYSNMLIGFSLWIMII